MSQTKVAKNTVRRTVIKAFQTYLLEAVRDVLVPVRLFNPGEHDLVHDAHVVLLVHTSLPLL